MRKKIVIISLAIVLVVAGWAVYELLADHSDMWNTQKILVTVKNTGQVKEIDDKATIKKIVRVVLDREQPGDMDMLDELVDRPYTYSLEFFTQNEGYGPLLCYKDIKICQFEEDTLGYYIEVSDDFFKLIEDYMK